MPLKPHLLILSLFLLLCTGVHAMAQDLVALQPRVLSAGPYLRQQTIKLNLGVQNRGTSTAAVSLLQLSADTFRNAAVADSTARLYTIPALAPGDSFTFVADYQMPYLCEGICGDSLFFHLRADAGQAVSEADENNNLTIGLQGIRLTSTVASRRILRYPLVFIHGLTANDIYWNTLINRLKSDWGLTRGGALHYCLNGDGNLATANIYGTREIFMSDSTRVGQGDIFTINFSVDSNGTLYPPLTGGTKSNQSAIFKQGNAVRDALARILAATGAEYVHLVGHSMGGLASRAYLQDSSLWQPDGKHHVAKLSTLGTPHGGSDASAAGIPIHLDGLPDELAEATRDLRIDYGGTSPGVYLFGGIESTSVLDPGRGNAYYNIDVNCNGRVGDTVRGINQRPWLQEIPVACLQGTGSAIPPAVAPLTSDQVVPFTSSNLGNYLTVNHLDTFNIRHFQTLAQRPVFHANLALTYLQKVYLTLDEPGTWANQRTISANTAFYSNFFAMRPANTANMFLDSDYFKLESDRRKRYFVSIRNLSVPNMTLDFHEDGIVTPSVSYTVNQASYDATFDSDKPLTVGMSATVPSDYSSNARNFIWRITSVPAPQVNNVNRCGPGLLNLSVLDTNATRYRSINWYDSLGATTPFVTGPTYSGTYTSTDSVYVAFENELGQEGPRQKMVLTINPLPQVNLAVGLGGHLLNSLPCVGCTREWSRNDTIVSITADSLLPTLSGSYVLKVTNAAGCIASDTILVTSLSTAAVTMPQFSVYPNPTPDKVTVDIHATASGTLSITNVLGQLIYQEKIAASNLAQTMSVELPKAGMYFIHFAGKTLRVVRDR